MSVQEAEREPLVSGDVGPWHTEQARTALTYRRLFDVVAPDGGVLVEADPPPFGDEADPVRIGRHLAKMFTVVLAHRRQLKARSTQEPRQLDRSEAAIDKDVRKNAYDVGVRR